MRRKGESRLTTYKRNFKLKIFLNIYINQINTLGNRFVSFLSLVFQPSLIFYRSRIGAVMITVWSCHTLSDLSDTGVCRTTTATATAVDLLDEVGLSVGIALICRTDFFDERPFLGGTAGRRGGHFAFRSHRGSFVGLLPATSVGLTVRAAGGGGNGAVGVRVGGEVIVVAGSVTGGKRKIF